MMALKWLMKRKSISSPRYTEKDKVQNLNLWLKGT